MFNDLSSDLIPVLREAGLIQSPDPELSRLSGGVSCDVFLVQDGGSQFVIKRALEKLRVKDDWFADKQRNRFEHLYMRHADRVVPGCVPRILHADDDRNFFAMEYFGEGWENWKIQLLEGTIHPGYARSAGAALGAIHRTSWGDEALRAQFATTANFSRLRIDPYLLVTGAKNPALESYFRNEAARLAGSSMALVHGDFSPKNLLVASGSDRVVIVDCEVAWFGDPAFDLAFFLNHMLLKAVHHPEFGERYLALGGTFLEAYRAALQKHWSPDLECRTVRLLLMLLLARVDGKSPAEYLQGNSSGQQIIREFVARELPRPPDSFGALAVQFSKRLVS